MLKIPVSIGELVDKITILEIKIDRMKDGSKIAHCRHELAQLQSVVDEKKLYFPDQKEELKKINDNLWVIEDQLRVLEKKQDFGSRFVELARSVYFENDKRASVKRRINDLAGSEIVEEKEYVDYK